MAPLPKLTKRGKRRLAVQNYRCHILILRNGYKQKHSRTFFNHCRIRNHHHHFVTFVTLHGDVFAQIEDETGDPHIKGNPVQIDAKLYQLVEKYDIVSYITNRSIQSIFTAAKEAPATPLTLKMQRYAAHAGTPFIPACTIRSWLHGKTDLNKWL